MDTPEVWCDWLGEPVDTRHDGDQRYCQSCGSTDHTRFPRPMPGDAVRLAEDWFGAKAGAIGVIQGMVGVYPDSGESSIIFHPSTHRDDRVVVSSGGPGTISTDLGELCHTGEQYQLPVWRFKNGIRRAHNGEHYTVIVPLWEWTPSAHRRDQRDATD